MKKVKGRLMSPRPDKTARGSNAKSPTVPECVNAHLLFIFLLGVLRLSSIHPIPLTPRSMKTLLVSSEREFQN